MVLCWLLEFVTLRAQAEAFKELEIIVLRHELAILRGTSRRPRPAVVDRMFLAAASRLLPRAHWRSLIVTPGTLNRWHRRLVAKRWRHARPVGRPPRRRETRERCCGSRARTRAGAIHGLSANLKGLGIAVSGTTVRTWLRAAGIGPAGKRGEMTWREFRGEKRSVAGLCVECATLNIQQFGCEWIRPRLQDVLAARADSSIATFKACELLSRDADCDVTHKNARDLQSVITIDDG